MAALDLENMWIYVAINVIVWIVISGLLEVLFFNGEADDDRLPVWGELQELAADYEVLRPQ